MAQVKRVVQYRKTYKLEGTQTKYALEVYAPRGRSNVVRMDLVSNHRITEVGRDWEALRLLGAVTVMLLVRCEMAVV